ncbi:MULTISPECIES: hypothetical protein [unclassified Corynebacterium]|uniref:hypothetical protein n=1 Tax=unclassified Corynebacterium TaxID=2624378 RepID=UPI002A91F700|nr:hypothetical protein [Corynebacterium sp.]MDY5786543.1 hypothetical protein [Corynebacterium sp.]
MTLQPRPNNPIEQRKQAVRRYSRNAVVWAGGGLAGGLALAVLLNSWLFLALGLIAAVAGGWSNYSKVQKIVNHRDNF